jgi:threonine aldolase
MFFASDNSGPVHPAILESLSRANAGYAMGYGNDPYSKSVALKIRDTFEAPEAAVYLVPTGTAANSLILATMTNPWDTVFCTPMAHINCDECNAPEFYMGGAKLTLVGAQNAKMTPETLRASLEAEGNRGVHGPQRGPVSITTVTERGTIYSLEEIRAISAVTKEYGLKLHLDGARFANAMVALGATPAEMSWKAGVDAVSFGGTKNGCMGVEACVIFDPELAWEFELRRKRAAHLFSKHRFLAAQMDAYLEGGLWAQLARAANAATARLVSGLKGRNDIRFAFEPQANIIFFEAPRALHQHLLGAGAVYYVEDGEVGKGDPAGILTGRLVCDWSMTSEAIDQFLALLAG